MTMQPGPSNSGSFLNPVGHFFDDPEIDTRIQEWGSQGAVYAAPGYLIVIESYFDGKRQRIAVDENEVDELCRRLHSAKRYSRVPEESR